jgi:PKD repeat protein
LSGPSSGFINQVITFSDAGSSDPDGDQLTYSWVFGDGGVGIGVSVTHAYTSAGTFTVALTVSDPSGATATAQTSVTITNLPPGNVDPIAIAGGPYAETVGTPITMNASASNDPDGDPLTYAWDFGDGNTGSGPTPTHTYASSGTYTVILTVNDGQGGTDTASTTATISPVQPGNLPPVANAGGPYTGTAQQPVTFDASGSTDPNVGDVLTFAWNFGDGGTGSGDTPSHTYASAGTFTVTVTVNDGHGGSASATASATISAAPPVNTPPVITAMVLPTPSTVVAGQTVAVTATATDNDGDALTFSWNFGDGSASTPPVVTTDASHMYSSAGSYTVTLTVADGRGGIDTAQGTISVTTTPTNRAPVAIVGGPYAGVVGEPVTMSAVGSLDPDGDSLTFAWSFGDGVTGSGTSVTHAYGAAATYTVTVTVTDQGGLSDSASTNATISVSNPGNGPPTVSVTVPSQGLVLQNLVLIGSGSDPDADTLSYSWNFGDGTSSAFGPSPSVVHEYTQAGTFVATLTVNDGQGHSVSTGGSVTITMPTQPVAFDKAYRIGRRSGNVGVNQQRWAIELDGAGVPPLRFNIVAYPQHWASDAQTFDLVAGLYYRWWDPFAGRWRPECIGTTSLPESCLATFSGHVDIDGGTDEVLMTPDTAPPTVNYTPERCWIWSGLTDSFSFTVTDGNGVTSPPAVVGFTLSSTTCHAPTF